MSNGMFLTSVGLAASELAGANSVWPSDGALETGGDRNVAAGASAVLDYDRLAEPLLKSRGHCAHHDVDAAAGRERDDEGDRPGRKLLSEVTATERKEAYQRERNQNGTTCNHCSFPSPPGRLHAQSPGAYVAASHCD